MKFCRYCDGMIVWGTEVCPHCGETLKVAEFDDLDFVDGTASGPPAMTPTAPSPSDEDEDELETVEFEALDVPTTTQDMPVLRPVSAEPPVVKPLPAGPPVVKPLKRQGGPPVMKPMGGSSGPPVMKPMGGQSGPPVMKPIPAGPAEAPVLAPIGGGAPDTPPPGPVEDCPLCGEAMVLRGGACRNCGKIACQPCLMRANGMRAGRVMEMNRVRWSDRSKKMGPDRILCPQCGKKGVELT
jgi:hypothetical protein